MNFGTYNYFLNGEPTGVIETFESKILPDGSKFTTAIRDAKPFNTMITVEAVEKDGKFQNCKIDYKKDNLQIEAIYEFAEKTFHVLRKINDKIEQDEKFDFPENCIIFPLMRCFQGQTILQVAEQTGFSTVIVPNISEQTTFLLLLSPNYDKRTANLLETKGNLRVFRYLSQHYDDNSEFYLDENGLLVFYKFHQAKDKIWTIKLKS